MENVIRIPAADDFGFVLRDKETDWLVGRCFHNPGGVFVSDFYGPGSPGIPVDCGEERIEYWFYNREKMKMPTGESVYMYVATGCTTEQFTERFGLKDLAKETHLDGQKITD
jgi:hypothetical protein